MAQIDRSEELRSLLKERDEWHVWILEYGITHHLVSFALHPGTYPRSIRVLCMDCVRIEGALQGGPYRLALEPIDWHGQPMWELRSADGGFRLIYGSLSEIRRKE